MIDPESLFTFCTLEPNGYGSYMYIKKRKHQHVDTPEGAHARETNKEKTNNIIVIGSFSHLGTSTEFRVICHPPPHMRKYTSHGRKMTCIKSLNSVPVHSCTFKSDQQCYAGKM